MPWWLTVYCKRELALTPRELKRGIRGEDDTALAGVDYLTLSEWYGLDETEVKPALSKLAVKARSKRSLDVEVSYGGSRAIVVHPWTTTERVAEELSEARANRSPPPAAATWLDACRAIVGIELGYSQLEDLGIVLAYEIARYLAQKGEGVIADDDGKWQCVREGAFEVL